MLKRIIKLTTTCWCVVVVIGVVVVVGVAVVFFSVVDVIGVVVLPSHLPQRIGQSF